jgi:hypothetical protein
MAGMRALGRVCDQVPAASGVAICLKDCSGVEFTAVASSTATTSLAFTAATSFGGTYVNVVPASGFGQPNTWYLRTANTAAWAAQAASWSTNVLTIGATSGYISVVDFLVSQLADTYDYLKVTAVNASLQATLYDLTVARIPANLRIPSA